MVKFVTVAEDIMLIGDPNSGLEANRRYGENIQMNGDHMKTFEQKHKLGVDNLPVQQSLLLNYVQEAECDTDSSQGEQNDCTEDEEDDEEIAKQLAKTITDCLPEVLNKQNTSHAKHAEGIVTTFKIKGSEAEEDSVTFKDKCLSKTGPDENISWTPEIQFTSSTIKSKCDSGKTINQAGQELDKHLIKATVWQTERQLQDGLLVPSRNPKFLNKLARKQVKDTLGAKWFDMSAQTITPELKKDLQLLKLRSVLDPKRHYKADDSKGLPKYFQVGTVIEPATEFYSGRLTKKERKATIADELLSNPDLWRYRKRKFAEIEKQRNAVSRKGRKPKNSSLKHGR